MAGKQCCPRRLPLRATRPPLGLGSGIYPYGLRAVSWPSIAKFETPHERRRRSCCKTPRVPDNAQFSYAMSCAPIRNILHRSARNVPNDRSGPNCIWFPGERQGWRAHNAFSTAQAQSAFEANALLQFWSLNQRFPSHALCDLKSPFHRRRPVWIWLQSCLITD